MSSTDLAQTDFPKPRLDHVRRLTDDTGIYQHAFYSTPDPNHGYTTDDNARALIASLQYARATGDQIGLELASRYLSFLRYAQRRDGSFHNFMAYDRSWLDRRGSDDCQGRSIWSLGYAFANAPIPGLGYSAEALLDRSLEVIPSLDSPRSKAFSLLGLASAFSAEYQPDRLLDLTRSLADQLLDLWHANASGNWRWFENILSYSNPKFCEGLLAAYTVLPESRYLEVALESLAFLLDVYFDGDMLDIIGQNGWYPRGGPRAIFDQQPVDAQAMVQACLAAYQVTEDEHFFTRARDAFAWFLGRNRLGQSLYDETTGGCFDGLHPDRLNGNQGSESTLAYLLARLAFEMPTRPAPSGRTLRPPVLAGA